MDSNRLKSNGFKHISQVYNDSVNYIRKRKDGEIVPLETSFGKLNNILGGGFQSPTTYVIGGRPGVGKSAVTNRILFDIAEQNDISKYIFLYWNWEMPNYRQIVREVSGRLNLTVNQILSADEKLSLEHYEKIKELKSNFDTLPLYMVERSFNAEQIFKINEAFTVDNPDYTIVNIFDHSRLVRKKSQIEKEEEKIFNLLESCVEMSRTMDTINILLSQLNRDIESQDRISNPIPRLSDFFGADAVSQFANVAIILQRPEMYDLGTYLGESCQDLLAMHILKNRDGDVSWIPFNHDFARNHIEQRYGSNHEQHNESIYGI